MEKVAVEYRENFFERTLANLAGAWREVAQGAARTLGRSREENADASREALRQRMAECLEARGGEVSARLCAAELGRIYLEMDAAGRRRFLEVLAQDFAVDAEALDTAMSGYRKDQGPAEHIAATRRLRQASVPPRARLLTQFNALPEGVKFLVDLRQDLLQIAEEDPHLSDLDEDLRELLASWFDTGFLDMKRIAWDSPAALLEKLIAYEAVHEIRSWSDLRNRLESDRRCYALFHPRMPDEPLAFVEIALTRGMGGSIQTLLDESAPKADPAGADTAIFYSISNTQRGLKGIAFGEFLIKMAVERLASDLPRLKVFATLSPLPGFRRWLDRVAPETLRRAFTVDEEGGLRALGGSDQLELALSEVLERTDWHRDPVVERALKGPLLRLAALYIGAKGKESRPLDPVMRFHLRNGARLERVNWLGDSSPKGLEESAGLMVNYRYILDDIEKNHEAYMQQGTVALGTDARALTKAAKANGARS